MKKILAIGTLLLSCSLFAAAQSNTPDQIDLSSTPCWCQQYSVNTPQASNDQANTTAANPESMPSSMASPSVKRADQGQDDSAFSYPNSQDVHQITR